MLGPDALTALADALERLAQMLRQQPAADPIPSGRREPEPLTWREKLWTVPPETRIGVTELAESVARPKSFVYRHVSPHGAVAPIPCRKLAGELVFVVGEVRRWICEHEQVIVPGRVAPLMVDRRSASAARAVVKRRAAMPEDRRSPPGPIPEYPPSEHGT